MHCHFMVVIIVIDYISEIIAVLGIAFGAGIWVTYTKINNKNIDKIEQKLDIISEEIQNVKVDVAIIKTKQTDLQNRISRTNNEPTSYI